MNIRGAVRKLCNSSQSYFYSVILCARFMKYPAVFVCICLKLGSVYVDMVKINVVFIEYTGIYVIEYFFKMFLEDKVYCQTANC